MPYAAPRLNLQVDAGFTFKKAVFMHCPSAQSTAAAAAAAAHQTRGGGCGKKVERERGQQRKHRDETFDRGVVGDV